MCLSICICRKTTIAKKVLGPFFCALNVIPSPDVVAKKSGDLQATYVGQTAPQVRSMFEEGWGKTLFIDEIGCICGPGALYSQEAVAEMLTHLEDSKGRFVFVGADYEHNVESVLRLNDGLASRVPYRITVPPWGPQQSTKTLRNMMSVKFQIDLSDHHELIKSLFQSITSTFTVTQDQSWIGFASGRTVEDIATMIFDAHIATRPPPGGAVSADTLRQVFTDVLDKLRVKVANSEAAAAPKQSMQAGVSVAFQTKKAVQTSDSRKSDALLSDNELKAYSAAIAKIDSMKDFQDRYNENPALLAQDKADSTSDYNRKLGKLLGAFHFHMLTLAMCFRLYCAFAL